MSGIDYGMGQTNVDHSTGIRYGVIPMGDVCQAWCDSSESDYGEPTCPKCGGDAMDEDTAINAVRERQARDGEPVTDIDDVVFEPLHSGSCADHYCADCGILFGSDEAYGDEALGHNYDADGYKATQGGDDSDIFILLSPYYTRAQYCSPCAPGACHLRHPEDDGDRAYCFGHDWFDDGCAPYPVYEVATGKLVPAPVKDGGK